jgi:small-conductance mechanosensitive channel
MLVPIDYSSIQTALASPMRWAELAVVGACFGFGWLLDRRVRLKSASEMRGVRVSLGSVNRVVFPITTLVLLLIAGAVFRRWGPPFFISIALPLTVALALIRLLVYGMRELFGAPSWLPASERAVGFGIWGLVLLYFIGVLPEVADELSAMQLPIGARSISVYEVLRGTLAVLLTLAVTLWLSGLVEQRLLRAPNLDTSLRTVLGKFIRALLLIAGVLFALQAVGIDLTLLGVFGGALGVGIGLGLQKLASNYIAGFTILLDRSIRLGDMITVDNRYGVVSKVTARYVVVRSLDGVEAIVPNETLVITTVLNHSYSTREVRLGIPVQISYDSDLDLALKVLAEVARGEPRVRETPSPPVAYVVRFADNGIDLELGVWINDPENGQLNLRSALNKGIWRAVAANGIKIPSLQREFRLISAAEPRVSGSPSPSAASGPTTRSPLNEPTGRRSPGAGP